MLGAATLALGYRLVKGAELRALPRELGWPVAAFASWASLSVLWSDADALAQHLLEYFLLPFVALVAVVAYAPVEAWLPRVLAVLAVALATLFAVVGLIQEATQRLIFYTPAVEIGNAYSSFFRVTSFFRDPSLYGRHVVLGLAVLLVLVWYRRIGAMLGDRARNRALRRALLLVLAVEPHRAVRRAARRRPRRRRPSHPSGGGRCGRRARRGGGAFVGSRVASASTERITSDRSRRIELTMHVIEDHPLIGVGLGAQPRASQQLSERGGPPALYVSHTTPLTVAAELGVIGLLLYLLVLAGEAYALFACIAPTRSSRSVSAPCSLACSCTRSRTAASSRTR